MTAWARPALGALVGALLLVGFGQVYAAAGGT